MSHTVSFHFWRINIISNIYRTLHIVLTEENYIAIIIVIELSPRPTMLEYDVILTAFLHIDPVVPLHGQNWSRQFWVMTYVPELAWGNVLGSHVSFRYEKNKNCGTISAQLLYPTVHWYSVSVTLTLPGHCIPSLKWHSHDLWILHIDLCIENLASSILIRLSYAISYSKFYRNPSGWLSHTSTWSKCEMIVIVVLWILFLWSSPEIVKNVNPFPYKTTSYKVPNDSLTFLPLQQFFYLLPLPCGMWQSGGWNLAECSHVMVTCLWPCIG